jgi:hypothetical protein
MSLGHIAGHTAGAESRMPTRELVTTPLVSQLTLG